MPAASFRALPPSGPRDLDERHSARLSPEDPGPRARFEPDTLHSQWGVFLCVRRFGLRPKAARSIRLYAAAADQSGPEGQDAAGERMEERPIDTSTRLDRLLSRSGELP